MSKAGEPVKASVVSNVYRRRVAAGALDDEPAQYKTIEKLDSLSEELSSYRLGRKSSALGWLFAKKEKTKPQGLYIWGNVGRGKTMLMDLFFETSTVKRKKRIHFHAFMRDIHKKLHEIRQDPNIEEDAVDLVISEIVEEAWLLCFDEFIVTDIADAMVMARLFDGLFAEGVIVVATSNTAPDNLYKDGLQRARFLPFIDTLKLNMTELSLDHQTDYRGEFEAHQGNYIFPLSFANKQVFAQKWKNYCENSASEMSPVTLTIQGRDWVIAQGCGGAAYLKFDKLCREPRGAADYLALAEKFSHIFLSDVPILRRHERNEARRFILLIDTLYDQNIKLSISADAEPCKLYPDGDHVTEFERTASRLTEMQTDEYFMAT